MLECSCQSMAVLNDVLHDRVSDRVNRSESVVIFSALRSIDNKAK